jgi:CubicO group peptidase (beta-lactamase class C family)
VGGPQFVGRGVDGFQRGQVEPLDGDVGGLLRSWRIPENPHTRSQSVTLRGLLSHTSGLTVHGFPGYPAGATVPSLVEILEGAGNTAPVVVTQAPGTAARYSGGGYTVAQLLIEDVTGESFAAVAEREVLRPLGMERSTFAQPLPTARNGEAAIAHGRRGVPVRGRWHTYPEQAAAGLWTTPADLARFLLALRRAWSGDEGAILHPESIRTMLTPALRAGPRYGLGIGVFDNGGGLQVEHGGANHGYRALMRMYVESGDGVVIMTNAHEDGELRMEILRAVARVYRWPDRP